MQSQHWLLLIASVAMSCSRAEPSRQDRGQAPGRETDPVAAISGQPPGSSTAVASADAHGTRLEGPREENMGRNWEGRLQYRVNGLSQPLDVRYLSRGERGRLQIDRPGSSFDAIFAGDQAIVFDHGRRRYRTFDLNHVSPRAEPGVDVKLERTEDRREVAGLLCYPWRLRSADLQVDACVRGLPGPFDTDKLETLSHLDIPAWVEYLIGKNYLPVTADVRQGERKLYSVELVQYSPSEVTENELAVPATYQSCGATSANDQGGCP